MGWEVGKGQSRGLLKAGKASLSASDLRTAPQTVHINNRKRADRPGPRLPSPPPQSTTLLAARLVPYIPLSPDFSSTLGFVFVYLLCSVRCARYFPRQLALCSSPSMRPSAVRHPRLCSCRSCKRQTPLTPYITCSKGSGGVGPSLSDAASHLSHGCTPAQAKPFSPRGAKGERYCPLCSSCHPRFADRRPGNLPSTDLLPLRE
ncbi:hypothetical protein DENSPDRAFT_667883 [Dentipellis sp. KUC8613]|nr:hypothetical protein DENSPDRAFT_667883 [Dentipellis sp. KUC8613]